MEKERDKVPGTTRIWATVVMLVLAGTVTFIWAWNHWATLPDRAQFGDLLSGVAGAVGFLGMAVALVLQTLELREQRRDLRLTWAEMEEARKETRAQTDQFKAQATIMEEQVRVTRLQNELLERQLVLTHQPLLSMNWEDREGIAVLVLRNMGHGQALLTEFRFRTPNWNGPGHERFLEALRGHYRAGQSPTVEFMNVEPGALVDPVSTVDIAAVRGSNKVLSQFDGFSIRVEFTPAQGGPTDYLQRTVGDAAAVVE